VSVGVPDVTGNRNQPLPTSTQWSTGIQMLLRWAVLVDVGYTGNHSYNAPQSYDLNTIDLGAAYLPQNQDPTLAASTVPGATFVNINQIRQYPGLGSALLFVAHPDNWITFHSVQLSMQRRLRGGLGFGFNDTITLYNHTKVPSRLQHNADGSVSERSDQAKAQELLGQTIDRRHIMKGNFVWQLPGLQGSSPLSRVVGHLINNWQVSGIWTGATGAAYAAVYSYSSNGSATNLTGSPNFTPRVRVVGDPGSGCSGDPLRQFNTAAFAGPLYNSDGLESGNGYLRGCFQSQFDTSLARNIKLGGAKNVQIRLDVFNLLNEARITGVNNSMTMASPLTPAAITNLPYDAAGNLVPARAIPKGAGFGVANTYQNPRSVQIQLRFSY
jgi:hypothetical protein